MGDYTHLPYQIRGYEGLRRYMRTLGIRVTTNRLRGLIRRNSYRIGGEGHPVFPNYTISALIKDISGVDAGTLVLAHKMQKEGIVDPEGVDASFKNVEWSRDNPLYVATCTNGVRETVIRDYRSGQTYITFDVGEAELWDVSWCKRNPKIYEYRRGSPHDPSIAKADSGIAKMQGKARTNLQNLRIVLVNEGEGTVFATAPARLFLDWNQGMCSHDFPFAAAFSSHEFLQNLTHPRKFFEDRYDHHEWFQYHYRRRVRQHTLELWREDFPWVD